MALIARATNLSTVLTAPIHRIHRNPTLLTFGFSHRSTHNQPIVSKLDLAAKSSSKWQRETSYLQYASSPSPPSLHSPTTPVASRQSLNLQLHRPNTTRRELDPLVQAPTQLIYQLPLHIQTSPSPYPTSS